MRKLALVAAVALLALCVPAAAEANLPSYQERLDAKRFARDWWASRNWRYGDGRTFCSGVRFRFRNYYEDPGVRRALAYQRGCTITFNKQVRWDMAGPGWYLDDNWWRFCVTAIHEYGHLPGMPYSSENPPTHSWNRNNVMARAESLSRKASWWPYFPGCRYEGDDLD